MEIGEEIKVCYFEGDEKRFVRGIFVKDGPDFIEMDVGNFRVQIFRSSLIKIEQIRRGML